jgi:hypothetical protein
MQRYLEFLHEEQIKNYSFFKKKVDKNKLRDICSPKFQDYNELQNEILSESNHEVVKYIASHVDLSKYYNNILFSTRYKTYIENVDFSNIRCIVNFRPINDLTHVNQHLCSVNKLLPDAGIYIGRVETYGERKFRMFKKFGNKFGQILWLFDFVINRVIPKIRIFELPYRLITRDRIHPISKAEILGRLVYCGFDIIDYSIIDNLFYFTVMKTCEPCKETEPTYHALIRLKRIGKGGKIIKVYKLRTMHPYSEFLQDYVIRLYEYNESGKPADDFRISRWGKFFRRFWIDEIPQLINVIKGEMKIVGVRPLSLTRFNEFPAHLKNERIKHKPGCIPPYVTLLMPDHYGNIEAESIYLKEKAQKPILTDLKYFFTGIGNILFNKIRGS